MKRKPRPQPERRDPDDPHLPHTTRYVKRDDLQIPPEAQAVIEQQWPEVIRTFQQYDKGAGMLMLYGTVRDACKAAGWDNSMAYLMRDYLIGKLNKEKVKTYTGSDYERGDWETFNMKESTPKAIAVVRSMKSLREGRHKAGCQCGFCKNMGSFGKKKTDDKADDKSDDEQKPTAESIVAGLLEDGQMTPRRIPQKPMRRFSRIRRPPPKANFYPSMGGPSSM